MVALICLGLAAAQDLPERLSSVDLHEAAYVEWMSRASVAETEVEARAFELRAGEALWAGEQWQTAARHFAQLETSETTLLGVSYSLYRDDSPSRALQVLDGSRSAEALYLAGWCHLQLGEAQEAYDTWGRVPSASPLHSQATALRGQIGGSWEIPHRSPRWAGVFSAVLPGAGQIYSGRARDGASALVVNGLLGALNWQLIQRELWVGVGFMGFVQLSFYGGNILAAANSAHKFNAAAWNTKLAMLTLYEPVLESRGARWSMVMAVP